VVALPGSRPATSSAGLVRGEAGGTDGSIGSAQCGREGLAQGVRCLDVVPAVARERLVA